MKLALTGATGFLGRSVLRTFVARGDDVKVLSRTRANDFPAGVQVCIGDLADVGVLRELCAGADVLVHMAAVGVQARNRAWNSMMDTNIGGSLRVLQQAITCGVRMSVMTGTVLEYRGGATFSDPPRSEAPLCEDDACDPMDPYGASKSAAGSMVRALAFEARHPLTYLRLASMLGRADDAHKLLPQVARALRAGQPIDLTSGEQRREWLHVEDGAQAVVAAVDRGRPGVINIGTGQASSLRHLVERLASRMGADAGLLRFGARPQRVSELRELVMDVSRAKQALGWEAKRTLDDCLDEVALAAD